MDNLELAGKVRDVLDAQHLIRYEADRLCERLARLIEIIEQAPLMTAACAIRDVRQISDELRFAINKNDGFDLGYRLIHDLSASE